MGLLSVHIENYEGPLDLLVHLVNRNEMNIFDVPVSEITDQFIQEILHMQELDTEIAAEFIHMASYLIYLKSRSLLPSGSAAGDELSLEEESFNLAQTLIEFAYCKELAVRMKEFADYSGRYLLRREGILLPKETVLSEDIYRLVNAYFEVTQIKPDEKVVIHTTKAQSETISAQTRKMI
ncbi:MAG: segregation/condensation protein A, partial [Deferribacteraceae bacterium]|nr:segregation/condensation protein A [Deferribacteraceae bacterium]